MRISKKIIFVTNLFCEGPCKIYFAINWSAKFILRRPLECKIYFAKAKCTLLNRETLYKQRREASRLY